MKKTLILTAFIIGGMILSSCKKNYSCTCDGPGIKDPEISTWKLQKEDAQANCDALNAQYELEGASCVLSPN